VLFGVNEEGYIQAGGAPIPDLAALADADLLFFVTRFMNLPDEQADLLVDYFERGGPVVGLRTSTHCFNGQEGKWAKLNYSYEGEDYRGGMGEQIFGNTWNKERGQSHYGSNHKMGGRITAVAGAGEHPVLTGVGAIHGYSGAYKSQPPADATPLVEVQVLNTFEPSEDIHTESPIVNAGWARDYYTAPSGEKKDARVVYGSFGASEDLLDEDARRFVVNSCLWALGMEDEITPELDVSIVGGFQPSPYSSNVFFRAGVKPSDLADWDSQIMPAGAEWGGIENEKDLRNPRVLRVIENRPAAIEELEQRFPGFKFEEEE